MLRRFNLLNLILTCMIILLGANVYKIWSAPGPDINISDKSSLPFDNGASNGADIVKTEKIFPSFYDVVVKKNIFRPQRSEWKPPPPPPPPKPEKTAEKKTDKKIILPDLKLTGVILLDDGRRVAIVEGSFTKYKMVDVITHHVSGGPTKVTKQVEEKKTITDHRLYVNDIIETFRVADILPDRLVLADNLGEEIVFMLGGEKDDTENPKDTRKGQADATRLKENIGEDDTIFINIKSDKSSETVSSASSSSSDAGANSNPPIINTGGSSASSSGKTAGQNISGAAVQQHISGK